MLLHHITQQKLNRTFFFQLLHWLKRWMGQGVESRLLDTEMSLYILSFFITVEYGTIWLWIQYDIMVIFNYYNNILKCYQNAQMWCCSGPLVCWEFLCPLNWSLFLFFQILLLILHKCDLLFISSIIHSSPMIIIIFIYFLSAPCHGPSSTTTPLLFYLVSPSSHLQPAMKHHAFSRTFDCQNRTTTRWSHILSFKKVLHRGWRDPGCPKVVLQYSLWHNARFGLVSSS